MYLNVSFKKTFVLGVILLSSTAWATKEYNPLKNSNSSKTAPPQSNESNEQMSLENETNPHFNHHGPTGTKFRAMHGSLRDDLSSSAKPKEEENKSREIKSKRRPLSLEKMDNSLEQNIPFITITFQHSSSILGESDTSRLQTLILDARAKGGIKEVTVAAWPDKNLPQKDEKLPNLDHDLAQARAQNIAKYMMFELDVTNIEIFNMADSSNEIAKAIYSQNVLLNSPTINRESKAPITKEELSVIRVSGGSSLAVVIVER